MSDQPQLFTAFSQKTSEPDKNDPFDFSSGPQLTTPKAENEISSSFSTTPITGNLPESSTAETSIVADTISTGTIFTPSPTKSGVSDPFAAITPNTGDIYSETSTNGMSNSTVSTDVNSPFKDVQNAAKAAPLDISISFDAIAADLNRSATNSPMANSQPITQNVTVNRPPLTPKYWNISDQNLYKKIDNQSNIKQTGIIIPAELLLPKARHMSSESQDDLKKICIKKLGHSGDRSSVLNVSSVDQSELGIRTLIKSNNLNAALKLSEILLNKYDSSSQISMEDFQEFVNYFHTRLAILVKIGKFKQAEEELRNFHNFNLICFYYKIDVSSKHTQEAGKTQIATFIPFSLRLLQIEVSMHLNQFKKCKDLLSKISVTLTDLKSLTLENNVHVNDQIAEKILNSYNYEFNKTCDKVYLQFNNYKLLSEAATNDLKTRLKIGYTTSLNNTTDKLNKGLIYLLSNDYKSAYEEFLNLLGDHNYNQAVIVNNAAIALVYQGKLEQAINLLESRLDVCTDCNIIRNLGQLLDLKCNDSEERKISVLERISHSIGDHFDADCFNF